MSLATDPVASRKAAQVVQGMPADDYWRFVKALGKADTVDELSEPFKTWMLKGYTNAKVTPKENQ